jgi:hypothetical protein
LINGEIFAVFEDVKYIIFIFSKIILYFMNENEGGVYDDHNGLKIVLKIQILRET